MRLMSEFTEYGLAIETGERNREESQRAEIPRWQPPAPGSLKINVDGAFDAGRGRGGVWLVLQDEMGQLQKIVAIPITNTPSAELVEALGFRRAASYARDG
ncbi:hypothetical protein RHMOL_Rhmol08G0145500 [Rhododendron molle]|uniref:Uncharacterized protein n=1 Tax=Rhododendron molle TaxID=49168 RepID=A0ACC0MNB6_RHOML|nr:hypothetical protein RHMOL_Rhmol08G0145500 [Rhododendron molle]